MHSVGVGLSISDTRAESEIGFRLTIDVWTLSMGSTPQG